MIELQLDELCKSFSSTLFTLKDITLTVAPGECLALVGPSGCGKTTLLRIIAGLEQPTTGRVLIDDRCVNNVPCHQRGVAMLFQRPALIPQQTVRHNLRWTWTLREPWRLLWGMDARRDEDLLRVARILDLEQDLDRPVQQLSGGQQQRVALGRCLLRQAKLCLLDEPLGHLDAPLRHELRRQMRLLAQEFRVTTIHVTHDPEEAFSVGDRVAVLQAGQVVQIEEPRQIRRFPANRFVAEMVHHANGGLNVLAGQIGREGDDVYFESVFGRWPISLQILHDLRESLYQCENSHSSTGKVHIMLGIAAGAVRCGADLRADEGEIALALCVQTTECAPAGSWVIATQKCGSWIGRTVGDERLKRGQAVMMAFAMERAYWFDHGTGRTLLTPK